MLLGPIHKATDIVCEILAELKLLKLNNYITANTYFNINNGIPISPRKFYFKPVFLSHLGKVLVMGTKRFRVGPETFTKLEI